MNNREVKSPEAGTRLIGLTNTQDTSMVGRVQVIAKLKFISGKSLIN